MTSLENMLNTSTFRKPERTEEEWRQLAKEVEEWEREQFRQKRAKRLESSGIPRGYMKAQAFDEVSIWANNPTKGLLLQGDVGRGKTYQACAALLIASENMTVRFTTFDDLLRECKATYQNADTEQAIISQYANVGMLCIDDMGKERVTEWSLPIIFSIINKRSMNDLPTIVTTQYTGRQLAERMTINGDSETIKAIISRFFEYARIRIEGKDWRRDSQ